MDDLEKEKKSEVTRLPPTTMEEAQKGLCTYSHFLDMAGFKNSSHYEGVMEIRKALNELATRKETIQPVFYMSVMWMVNDDQCKHFSECTAMEDFEGGGAITWPTTSLMRFAERMRDREKVDLIDLPKLWRTWLAQKSNPWSGDQGGSRGLGDHGGGRGRGGRGGQPEQVQPPTHQTGGGHAGGGGRTPGGSPPGVRHFGVKKTNTNAHAKVKAMLEPLKGREADTRSLIRAPKKRGPDMRNWPGRKEGDPVGCPEWTLGGCHSENCKLVHENVPAEYAAWICDEVKPGAEAILTNPPGWRAPDLLGRVDARGRP